MKMQKPQKRNCLQLLNWTPFEEVGAAEDTNCAHKPDSAVYRTTFDCIEAVRIEVVNTELERCIAYARLMAADHIGVARMAVENTVAARMIVDRMADEYRANRMIVHKERSFEGCTTSLALECRSLQQRNMGKQDWN